MDIVYVLMILIYIDIIFIVIPKIIGHFYNNGSYNPSKDEAHFSRHLCRKCNYKRLEGYPRAKNLGEI